MLTKLRCIIFGHAAHVPNRPELCSRCGHRMHVKPEVIQ